MGLLGALCVWLGTIRRHGRGSFGEAPWEHWIVGYAGEPHLLGRRLQTLLVPQQSERTSCKASWYLTGLYSGYRGYIRIVYELSKVVGLGPLKVQDLVQDLPKALHKCMFIKSYGLLDMM